MGQFQNPYMGYMQPMKSPQQMQQEFNQLINQYQNLMSQAPQQQLPPTSTSTTGLTQNGVFRSVNSVEEVTEAPTSLDGSATLFIDFKNKVFWAKKYINGSHQIQAYRYEAINSVADTKPINDDEIDLDKELPEFEPVKSDTEDRLCRLESMIEKLASNKSKNIKPIKLKGETKNEI